MNLKIIVISCIILVIGSICYGAINPNPLVISKYEPDVVIFDLDYDLPDLSLNYITPADKTTSILDLLFWVGLFGMYMIVILDMTFRGDIR